MERRGDGDGDVRGETIARGRSARCDWVSIALSLAAASWNDRDGWGTASSRDNLGAELLEPLVLHDTADVLAQRF